MHFVNGLTGVFAAMWVCAVATGHAQPWKPDTTMEISVGTAPGGGAVGLRYLNQHAGNGHFLQVYSPNVLAGSLVGQVPLNHTDITPIAVLYTENMLVAARTESPIKSGRELLDILKKDPKALTITVGIGLGNMNHIGAALPMRAAGADVKAVRAVVFNTIAESVTAVVGGHIDIVGATPSTVLAQVQAGKLRVLGIAAPQRVPGVFATAPTWREQGIDSVSSFWHAIIRPKGMTPPQTAYWEDQLATLAATDDWKAQLDRNYLLPLFLKSAESVKFLNAQHAELKSVLTDLGMAKNP